MSLIHPQEQYPQPELPKPGKTMLFLGILLRIWRKIENIAFVFLLLILALYFTLQSSTVQNWLITRISNYLSEELKTTVTIGHVDIAFFDNLVLEQVFIADLHGDTLLYAGQLSAGVQGNFFSALSNKLEFADVTLSRARVYTRRYEGEYDYNYDFFLDYFSSSNTNKPKKDKKPFQIKVRNLRLTDVVILQDNDVNGNTVKIILPKAYLQINNLDVPSKIADFEQVEVTGLRFDYQERDKKPMPPKPVKTSAVDSVGQVKAPAKPFRFSINRFQISESSVMMDRTHISPAKTTPDGVMDFNHLRFFDINFGADSLRFDSDLNLEGALRQFSLKEQSGFVLQQFVAQKMLADSGTIALYGMQLNTPRTSLGDTMLVRFKERADLKDFKEKVYLEARLKPGSKIHPYDAAFFDASLANNDILKKNQGTDIELSGVIKGKINRLDARKLQIKVGKALDVSFDFDGDDLARGKDVMRMEFDVNRLQLDIPALRQLVPSLKIPANLERLGTVRFAGTYNMLFGTNHVVLGKLTTNLGNGDLDMKLDMTGGNKKATYSGKLNMESLDLGAITGNKDLGKTSFHVSILPGSKGLTKESMKANIKGTVDTLQFRGYTYKALRIDGVVSESLFKGDMGIQDPNIDFTFRGEVNLQDTTPIYVFDARINRLDLGRLNLTKENLVVSAFIDNVRLTGENVADLAGIASVYDLKIVQNDSIVHHIDSIRFESNFQAQDFRHFAFRSDFLAASIDGNFVLSKAPSRFLQLISKFYPTLAAQLNLPRYDSTEITDLYRFGLYINNTKGLTRLIDPKLDTIRDVSIGGQIDGRNGISEMYMHLPSIKYAGKVFDNILFNWRSERNKAVLKLNLPKVKLSNRYSLSSINLTAALKDDVAQIKIVSDDPGAGVKGVDLKGELKVVDSLWEMRIKDSKFDLFGFKWAINQQNYIRFGPKYIDINGLMLENGPLRRMELAGINNGKGIKLELTNFDLNFVNEIVPVRGLTYSGKLSDFGVQIQDVFEMRGIEMGVATDTIFVNKKPYGRIDGNLSMADLQHPLDWKISSHDRDFVMTTTGGWLMGGKTRQHSVYIDKELNPDGLYSDIVATNFPMDIIQQLVPGVSNMKGQFDLDTKLYGKIQGKNTEIGLDGFGLIRDGSFKIDYLNTPFYVKNQKVILTDDRIWAEKDTVYDSTQGNMAFVKGGVRHNLFRRWRIDCEVSSPNRNFVLMNTTKNENPVYYGKGVGAFTAKFGGTFSKTDIKVDAVTGPGTVLNIPITTETEVKEAKFIIFKLPDGKTLDTPVPTNPTSATKRFSANDLKGLSVEMNLTLTQQAEVRMIFDEAAGDIISGWGNGDISVIINREGDFNMFGNYTFDRGEYLFTLVNLVNKPFKMDRGGTISWYGDPYQATINITTRYRENTPMSNLLQEELAVAGGTELQALANTSAPVDLIMYLTGDLFKPTITFNLEFPTITPQLRTYVDNRLRLLQQDPNELNRQVFGLIVFGTFLPQGNFIPSSLDAQISTLTQFMSSQLSRYASDFFSELFGNSVSNFDIDIDYQNSTILGLGGQAEAERNLILRMSSSFADNRITIRVGTMFGLGENGANSSPSGYNNSSFQGEDVVVEYQPNRAKQWKLRAYQRTEPNTDGRFEGIRSTFGVGATFSKDFDSYKEMVAGIGKWWGKNQ